MYSPAGPISIKEPVRLNEELRKTALDCTAITSGLLTIYLTVIFDDGADESVYENTKAASVELTGINAGARRKDICLQQRVVMLT